MQLTINFVGNGLDPVGLCQSIGLLNSGIISLKSPVNIHIKVLVLDWSMTYELYHMATLALASAMASDTA